MKKLLNILDFAKGYKTKASGIFLLVALLVNSMGTANFSGQELSDIFYNIINQLDVILGASGVIYGAIMKLIRKK